MSSSHHIILLDRGDYTSCTLNLHGATLTSWRINNKEMIFVSRQSHFTGLSHIRGGIQFAFPVIGDWEFGPNAGFAREIPWTVEEGPHTLDSGDVYALVSLSHNPYTEALWDFRFKLYYKITLYESKIVFSIGVENSSPIFPLTFNIMQHSLMRVPDVTECEIIGLKKCKYRDCVKKKLLVEDREKVTISEHTENIYYNAANEVIITNTVKGGNMKIIKKRTRDVTLWNPWIEKSKEITDLGS